MLLLLLMVIMMMMIDTLESHLRAWKVGKCGGWIVICHVYLEYTTSIKCQVG